MLKTTMKLGIFVLYFLRFFPCDLCATLTYNLKDDSSKENAKGENVVDITVERINSILGLKSDFSLLKRIALVETNFGKDSNAMKTYPLGGIWQISPYIHNSVMLLRNSFPLNGMIEAIEAAFGIKCFLCVGDKAANSGYNYSTPLRSGLAARLFIEGNSGTTYLGTLSEQAKWWANVYRRNRGDKAVYTEKVLEHEGAKDCNIESKMDVWFLLDGSISIGESNFELAIRFVRSVAADLGVPNPDVRMGFSVFAARVVTYISFKDNQHTFNVAVSAAEMMRAITLTGEALEKVLTDGFQKAPPLDNQTARVLIVITDGKSYDNVTDPVRKVHDEHIRVFAIGIGDEINEEEIRTIASDPDSRYSYILSEFAELDTIIKKEIKQQFCKIPSTVPDEPVLVSLRAGEQRHLLAKLNQGSELKLSFSTKTTDAQGTVFMSSVVTKPSASYHEYAVALEKGENELIIKASDLIKANPQLAYLVKNGKLQGGVIPIYMTVQSSGSSLETEIKSSQQTVDSMSTTPSTPTTPLPGLGKKLLGLWITLGILPVLIGIGILSFYLWRRLKKSKSTTSLYKRRSSHAEEIQKVLKVLKAVTNKARRPTATVLNLQTLEEQLDYAEKLEISEDKLKLSYDTAKVLKSHIDELLEELKELIEKANGPDASLDIMRKLQEKIKAAENLKVEGEQLKEAKDALEALKRRVQKLTSDLQELTSDAKKPSANTICADGLQLKINEATKMGLNPKDIKEAQSALDKLNERISLARTALKTVALSAKGPNATMECMEKLQQWIEEGENLMLPADELDEARQVLEDLRNRFKEIIQVLTELTEEGKSPNATIHTMEKLKNQFNLAENLNIPISNVKDVDDTLKRLKSHGEQVNNVKKDLEDAIASNNLLTISKLLEETKPKKASYLAWNPEDKALPELFQKALEAEKRLKKDTSNLEKEITELTAKGKTKSASVHTMRKLDEKIQLAESLHLPIQNINDAQETLKQLKQHDEEITNIKQDLEKATSGADLDALTKALDRAKAAKDSIVTWDPEDKDFLKLLKTASESEGTMKNMANVAKDLAELIEKGRSPDATVQIMQKLDDKIKQAEKANVSSQIIKEAQEVAENLKQRNDEVNDIKSELKQAVTDGDLTTLTKALDRVRPNEESLLKWNPDDKMLPDLIEKAKKAEDRLKQVAAELREITNEGKSPEATISTMRKLEEKLHSSDIRHIPSEDVKEAQNVLDSLRQRDNEINDIKKELKEATAKDDLTALTSVLDRVRSRKDSLLKWNPDDTVLPDLIEKALKAEDILKRKAAVTKEELEQRERLRNKLRAALDDPNVSKEELIRVTKEFEKAVGDLGEAEDKNLIATARSKIFNRVKQELLDHLNPAISNKDKDELKSALAHVDSALSNEITQSQIDGDSELKSTVDQAKQLLDLLSELERMREAILNLNQQTISEIRSYSQPPDAIRKVMEATLLLLGQKSTEVKNWSQLQAHIGKMGKDSLKRRIAERNSDDITKEAVKKAKDLLSNLLMSEVEEISKAAATFFAWSKCILQEKADMSTKKK